jgi:hypothetical protein
VALLVCGDISLARRTLFLLYFKSRRELEEVDVEEWAKKQGAQAPAMAKVSQLMTSSTPYLGLRLRALAEFHGSSRYEELKERVESGSGADLTGLFDKAGNLKRFTKQPKGQGSASGSRTQSPSGSKVAGRKIKVIEGTCPKCGRRFTLPYTSLPDKPSLDLRCKDCGAGFKVNLASIRKPKG